VRNPIYFAITAIWIAAVAFIVYGHRRDGLALTNRQARSEPATEAAR
jgi:hypothetical protein